MWSNCAKVFLDSEKNKEKGISTLESEITKPIKNIGKLCKLLNLKEDLRIQKGLSACFSKIKIHPEILS